MNVLIVGSGKGSFEMRAVQLGAAIGAKVVHTPTDADLQWADVVVLVKKYGALEAPRVQRCGKPIVWDALDFWRQPQDSLADETTANALLRQQIAAIKPVLTIAATKAMATACAGIYLSHHSWDGLIPTPPREHVQTVGYEGHAAALGHWGPAIEKECTRRKWTFLLNQPESRHADLILALRDGPWDGWICREWKSGVKVVNAIAAGRPLITQPSAAVRELSPAGSVIESISELSGAFDQWTDYTARDAVTATSARAAPAFTLATIADQYRRLLAGVLTCAG